MSIFDLHRVQYQTLNPVRLTQEHNPHLLEVVTNPNVPLTT